MSEQENATETPKDPVAPVAPAVKPGKPDWDAKLEQALGGKPPPAKEELPAAPDFAKQYGAALELLSKGEKVKAIRAIIREAAGGKISKADEESLLFDYAAAIDKPDEQEDPKELFKRMLAEEKAKDEAAAKKREEEEKTAREKLVEEQVKSMMEGAAVFIHANIEQFPWIKGYGAPTGLYQQFAHEELMRLRKAGLPEVIEPAPIFQRINDYHKERYEKTGLAPKKDEGAPAAQESAFARIQRLRGETPKMPEETAAANAGASDASKKVSTADQMRERLRNFDREQKERVRFGS